MAVYREKKSKLIPISLGIIAVAVAGGISFKYLAPQKFNEVKQRLLVGETTYSAPTSTSIALPPVKTPPTTGETFTPDSTKTTSDVTTALPQVSSTATPLNQEQLQQELNAHPTIPPIPQDSTSKPIENNKSSSISNDANKVVTTKPSHKAILTKSQTAPLKAAKVKNKPKSTTYKKAQPAQKSNHLQVTCAYYQNGLIHLTGTAHNNAHISISINQTIKGVTVTQNDNHWSLTIKHLSSPSSYIHLVVLERLKKQTQTSKFSLSTSTPKGKACNLSAPLTSNLAWHIKYNRRSHLPMLHETWQKSANRNNASDTDISHTFKERIIPTPSQNNDNNKAIANQALYSSFPEFVTDMIKNKPPQIITLPSENNQKNPSQTYPFKIS